MLLLEEGKNVLEIIENLKTIGLVNKEFENLAKNLIASGSVNNVARKYIQEYRSSAIIDFTFACAGGNKCSVKAFVNGIINDEGLNDI